MGGQRAAVPPSPPHPVKPPHPNMPQISEAYTSAAAGGPQRGGVLDALPVQSWRDGGFLSMAWLPDHAVRGQAAG